MFDCNNFKRAVKEWMQNNPAAEEAELVDFCEELIPAQHFMTHQWLVEQTVSWFRHVLTQRERSKMYSSAEEQFLG
jgi:hypothetical protein